MGVIVGFLVFVILMGVIVGFLVFVILMGVIVEQSNYRSTSCSNTETKASFLSTRSRKKHLRFMQVLFSTESAGGGRNPPAVYEIASRGCGRRISFHPMPQAKISSERSEDFNAAPA